MNRTLRHITFIPLIVGILDNIVPDWLPRLGVQCMAAPLGGITVSFLTNPLDIIRARIQVINLFPFFFFFSKVIFGGHKSFLGPLKPRDLDWGGGDKSEKSREVGGVAPYSLQLMNFFS